MEKNTHRHLIWSLITPFGKGDVPVFSQLPQMVTHVHQGPQTKTGSSRYLLKKSYQQSKLPLSGTNPSWKYHVRSWLGLWTVSTLLQITSPSSSKKSKPLSAHHLINPHDPSIRKSKTVITFSHSADFIGSITCLGEQDMIVEEASLQDWPDSWEITAFLQVLVSSYCHLFIHVLHKYLLNADSMSCAELCAKTGNWLRRGPAPEKLAI